MSLSTSATAKEDGYVVGAQTGKIEPRLEIDEFVLDKDVLNLFLLALIKLQDERFYHEPWSWFQISGIHGRPFADWDHVGGKHVERDIQAGYCSHSSVTFPTWHRPYVAMMEQAVYVAMVEIAKQFTDHNTQQNYLSACARFRYPYWDPCLPRDTSTQYEYGIPRIVSSSSVYVRKPTNPGSLVSVRNPLYEYRFPTNEQPLNNTDFLWGEMGQERQIGRFSLKGNALLLRGGNKHTVRAPNQEAETSDADINRYISEHIQSDIGSSLYKVLTVHQAWGTFSNDAADDPKVGWRDSLGNEIYHTIEGFHDNIHGFIGNGALGGGSGHMGNPQLAAFDPIFWLHHCNIDRITALWQTKLGSRDPSSWWERQAIGDANWVAPAGTMQTPSDPLVPFRKAKRTPGHETFWTSNDVRNWNVLGYTYLGKRIISGASGQNEMTTFPIDLDATNLTDLTAFYGQFYGWMDHSGMENHAPTPALIKQFYPIDLSTVEALTGNPSPERPAPHRAHPSRTPNDPTPDPMKPDYSHLEGLIKDGKLRQWNVNIHAEKFALSGSFQVFVFIGPFSQNPDDWPSEKNLAGIDIIFASDPRSGGCDNCEQQAESNLLVSDVIPLTAHLIKWIRSGEKIPAHDGGAIACKSLEQEDVVPFLTKNLHWRVANMHGHHHDRTEVPGLKVALFDQVVRLPRTFEEEPIYEDTTHSTAATHGRPGGLSHGESFSQMRIS